MDLTHRFKQIMGKVLAQKGPTREECAYMLQFPADSLEAAVLRGVADRMSRDRFGGAGVLVGRIGPDSTASGGGEHLTREQILSRTREFAAHQDLFALSLMTTDAFDFDGLLSLVDAVRSEVASPTRIVVKMGEFDLPQSRQLHATGADGVYCAPWWQETAVATRDPEEWKETCHTIRDAGLDLYYCCGPIGPDVRPEDVAEQIILGVDCGCFQHGVMRRAQVPEGPVAEQPEVTELRLAQVVAVATLATLTCPETGNIALPEPNLLGLTAGANALYAGVGAAPSGEASEAPGPQGPDLRACRLMLYEAGFTTLRRGDGEAVPLTLASEQSEAV